MINDDNLVREKCRQAVCSEFLGNTIHGDPIPVMLSLRKGESSVEMGFIGVLLCRYGFLS